MFSMMRAVESMFKVTPPFLKLSKNPGPTWSPMQNTKRIRPKSCTNVRMLVGPVNPMCPATMPAKSTKVTPSEIPPTLILPR